MAKTQRVAEILQPESTADERKKRHKVRFEKVRKAVQALSVIYQNNPETTSGFDLSIVLEESSYIEFRNVKNSPEILTKLALVLTKTGVSYRMMHYPTGGKITVVLTQVGVAEPVQPVP